jgi:hypothetical protein
MSAATTRLMDLRPAPLAPPDAPTARTETITYWTTAMRLALGAWTALVPLAAIAVFAYWLATKQTSPVFIGLLFPLLINHFIAILTYAFFASQNPRLNGQGFWMFSFVVAAPISTLLYWFLFVWPAPRSRRLIKTLYPD